MRVAIDRLVANHQTLDEPAINREKGWIVMVAREANGIGPRAPWSSDPRTAESASLGLELLDREIAAQRASAPGAVGPHETSASLVPSPQPLPYGVSPAGAEQLCADWMRHLGVADAEVTRYSQDGGIDVTSEKYVAQVKHWLGGVGAPTVREVAGIAGTEGRTGIVFASGSFSRDAVAFAERAGVLLFVFDPEKGQLRAASPAATKALAEGFGGR